MGCPEAPSRLSCSMKLLTIVPNTGLLEEWLPFPCTMRTFFRCRWAQSVINLSRWLIASSWVRLCRSMRASMGSVFALVRLFMVCVSLFF